MALKFISFEPPSPSLIHDGPHDDSERNIVRDRLNRKFNGRIVQMTGVMTARMWFAKQAYAKRVVIGLGVKVLAWPVERCPFANLSRIPGGVAALLEIEALFDRGVIQFVPSTPEDQRRAALNPDNVFPHSPIPNHRLPSSVYISKPRSTIDWPTSPFTSSSKPKSGTPPVTHSHPPKELVMSITDLALRFVLPASGQQTNHKRRQRNDVKKAHAPPAPSVSHSRPPKRRKTGPKTHRFIVPGTEQTVDDFIDEYLEVASESDPMEES
ncbi:hypothetical protein V8D89_004610 [Ganoderma adspersum]